MKTTQLTVLFAGGGTGGHLYPAIALAREVEKRAPECCIVFVGTRRGIEARIIPELGYKIHYIWLRGLQRRLNLRLLLFPLQLGVSIIQCLWVLLKLRPNIVVGTGGYVSGPIVFLAAMLKFPAIIQEQNSFPGMTTRWLARVVDQVHVTFEESVKYFKDIKHIRVSGNPIRSQLSQMDRSAAAQALALPADRRTVLVFGGSQGAHSINMAIVRLVPTLLERSDWQILWGTGELDYEHIRDIMHSYAGRVFIRPYIKDMASAYAMADLVVARAGATTVAELQACGLPVILIPYPHAAAGHQEANARALLAKDAVRMVLDSELESDKLLNELIDLMADDKRRTKLGNNLKKQARPDAAKHIVDEMMKLVGHVNSH